MKFKEWINHLKACSQPELAEASKTLRQAGATLLAHMDRKGMPAKTNFTYTFDGIHYGYIQSDGGLMGLSIYSKYKPNRNSGTGSKYTEGFEFTEKEYKEAVFCHWGEGPVKRWKDVQEFLDSEKILKYFIIE